MTLGADKSFDTADFIADLRATKRDPARRRQAKGIGRRRPHHAARGPCHEPAHPQAHRGKPSAGPRRSAPPMQWKALQTVHAMTSADVFLTSPEDDWDVAMTRFRLGQLDVNLPALDIPALKINYGLGGARVRRTIGGREADSPIGSGDIAILQQGVDSR